MGDVGREEEGDCEEWGGVCNLSLSLLTWSLIRVGKELPELELISLLDRNRRSDRGMLGSMRESLVMFVMLILSSSAASSMTVSQRVSK